MKKKFIIIIAILVIVAISIVIVFNIKGGAKKDYKEPLEDSEKILLAEKSYRNYAWGFVYTGSAIFNDGTIYEWDINDKTNFELDEIKEWILTNGKKSNKKVTSQDLNKIEKNLETLKDDIETENVAFDAGSSFTSVYKDGKEITLLESGDYEGKNETKESKELIKVIDKYLK